MTSSKIASDKIDYYFQRFGFRKPYLINQPNVDTGLIVVIPCFNEPEIEKPLKSIVNCIWSGFSVEILVIINASENAPQSIIDQNLKSIQTIRSLTDKNSRKDLNIYLIESNDLPVKHAGVGLARKIGMDEALFRFRLLDYNGVIVTTDADCTFGEEYIAEIHKKFKNAKCNFATLNYEHPIERDSSNQQTQAIIEYELFLRYYSFALKSANYPYFFQTIGSCMAVRATTYAEMGGMNKRKAGEDFYFLHKLAPAHKHYLIPMPLVFPSGRESDRVPFGTGKAVSNRLNEINTPYLVYHPAIFLDLKQLLLQVDELFKANSESEVELIFLGLPQSVQQFLNKNNFLVQWKRIQMNTKRDTLKIKAFYQWFDGFLVMKFVHFATENCYLKIPVLIATRWMLLWSGFHCPSGMNEFEMLKRYRRLVECNQK